MLQDVIDYEENVQGQLSQWVQRPEVLVWIRKHFQNFLCNFKNEFGVAVYLERIRDMCANYK
jgi:hypothetical protein